MRNLIIEDIITGEKTSTVIESDMSLEDIAKAIEVYDRYINRRSEVRRARYAKTQEELERAFNVGRISRSTYYRRLKQLGLPPEPPH